MRLAFGNGQKRMPLISGSARLGKKNAALRPPKISRPSATGSRASRRPGPAPEPPCSANSSLAGSSSIPGSSGGRTIGITAGMLGGLALGMSCRCRNSGAAATCEDSDCGGGAGCAAAVRFNGSGTGAGESAGVDYLRRRWLERPRSQVLARRLDAARRRHRFVEFLGLERGALVRRQCRDRGLPLKGIQPSRSPATPAAICRKHSRPRSRPDRAARAPRAGSRPGPGRCRRARCARFPPSASPPAGSALMNGASASRARANSVASMAARATASALSICSGAFAASVSTRTSRWRADRRA